MKQHRFYIALLVCLYGHIALASDITYEYEDDSIESTLILKLTDLKSIARLASLQRKPILLEFSTPWCEYCIALEQLILEPLIRNQESSNIIIRKLEVSDYSSIIDFDGSSRPSTAISARYKVDLYPTLVFFDSSGNEISERIVGITVLDYVSEQLDIAIKTAIESAAAYR